MGFEGALNNFSEHKREIGGEAGSLKKATAIVRALAIAGTIGFGLFRFQSLENRLDNLSPDALEAFYELTHEKFSKPGGVLGYLKDTLTGNYEIVGQAENIAEAKRVKMMEQVRIAEKERKLWDFFGSRYSDDLERIKERDEEQVGEQYLSDQEAKAVVIDKALIATDGLLTVEGTLALCERTFPEKWVDEEVGKITYFHGEKKIEVGQYGKEISAKWTVLAHCSGGFGDDKAEIKFFKQVQD